ncbi:hypothetical protein EDC04DRAFT_2601927 [Pisolithus marmoratus]|nr:hypothetical protein EDC04DRAFT_2601927 [Pisolithus marmoratus]
MAPRRKTRHVLDDKPGNKTITLDAAPVICHIPSLPIFPRPLRVHPVSRVACTPSGTVTASSGTCGILGPGRSTSKPSSDVEEAPVTRSELRLFKETIQLELDGTVNAINEAANSVKVHLEGKSLGMHRNIRDQETPPSLQGHHKVKGLPTHRRPADLEFQKLIREHALLLMKCEDKHSPFTNVPDKAEVEVYAKGTQQPCCTTDNFRVDLNDTPTSVYAKQQMVARKEQARILNLMSGHMNEQGYESPLAGIRSLHRYQQQWTATAGAWPHMRMPSSQLSNQEQPSGLPKNFYAQDYLSSLTSEGLDDLLLQEDIHLDIP